MIKIGMIRGFEVFFNEDVCFINNSKNEIVLGKFFKSLSNTTQNFLLNRALMGIEYVNIHKINNSKEVEYEIDTFINRKYSLKQITSCLKEMHKLLHEQKNNEKYSKDMCDLSDRYINLNKQRLVA